jgi:hypothetical protein
LTKATGSKVKMVKSAIDSEAFKWDWMPFSFSPSDALLGLLRRRQNAYAEGRKQPPERRSVMCQNCGSVLVIGKERERGITIPERYCDLECAREDRSRVYKKNKTGKKTPFTKAVNKQAKTDVFFCNCLNCKKRVVKKTGSLQFCTNECKRLYFDQKSILRAKSVLSAAWLKRYIRNKRTAKEVYCKQCGCNFTQISFRHKAFCSDHCIKRHERRQRRYLKRAGHELIDSFSRNDVFDRDKWRCKQCRQKVVLPTGNNDANEATVDHIMPVSKGGKHVWGNVQCLCRRCNTLKNDSVKEGIQLCLF